ncbi:hypothetical protein ACWEV3_40255 [Saccharopolyspora sp. NPDC003752]
MLTRNPEPSRTQDPTEPGQVTADDPQCDPQAYTRLASIRYAHTLGPRPSMRMPGNSGGILIENAQADPSGGLAALSGTWDARLNPSRTPEGTLVLQLLPPANSDCDRLDRADVWLWLARRGHWHRLGHWPKTGWDWPHRAAPLIRAALG